MFFLSANTLKIYELPLTIASLSIIKRIQTIVSRALRMQRPSHSCMAV